MDPETSFDDDLKQLEANSMVALRIAYQHPLTAAQITRLAAAIKVQ